MRDALSSHDCPTASPIAIESEKMNIRLNEEYNFFPAGSPKGLGVILKTKPAELFAIGSRSYQGLLPAVVVFANNRSIA